VRSYRRAVAGSDGGGGGGGGPARPRGGRRYGSAHLLFTVITDNNTAAPPSIIDFSHARIFAPDVLHARLGHWIPVSLLSDAVIIILQLRLYIY